MLKICSQKYSSLLTKSWQVNKRPGSIKQPIRQEEFRISWKRLFPIGANILLRWRIHDMRNFPAGNTNLELKTISGTTCNIQ